MGRWEACEWIRPREHLCKGHTNEHWIPSQTLHADEAAIVIIDILQVVVSLTTSSFTYTAWVLAVIPIENMIVL